MAWPGALAIAGLAWTAATVALYANQLPPLAGLAALIGGCALVYRLMPDAGGAIEAGPPPPWDLTLRMSTAAALVLALTSAAAWLGPSLSGFLASFPLATTILVAFAHAQRGPSAVVAFFRGFLPVLPVFGVFCVLLSELLGRVPIVAAFGAALAIQVALQLIILSWMRR
jgi:hypothetical protein